MINQQNGKPLSLDDEDVELEEDFPSESSENHSEDIGGGTGNSVASGMSDTSDGATPGTPRGPPPSQSNQFMLTERDWDYIAKKQENINKESDDIRSRAEDMKTRIEKPLERGNKISTSDLTKRIDREGGDIVAKDFANLISQLTTTLEYIKGQLSSIILHTERIDELNEHITERTQQK